MNREQLFRGAIRKALKNKRASFGEMRPAQLWLGRLLGILRAQHLLFWTSHWQAKGGHFYGDHLLFERLYGDELQGEIDGLAEKMVAYFGVESVNLMSQMRLILPWVRRWEGSSSIMETGLMAEKDFQFVVEGVYNSIDDTEDMTLGLDDFLMSMANRHETSEYLLGQRLQKNASVQASNRPIRDQYGREWSPRRGLEGPFLYRGGQVLYYDPREKGGTYYDPTTDMYLSHAEASRIIIH